jgi:hypothetical protein
MKWKPPFRGHSGTLAQAAFAGSGELLRVARDTLSWEGLHFYTDRLCLRTPTPRDADAPYDLFTDSEVMQEAARPSGNGHTSVDPSNGLSL